ncbi:hypothetical protein [Burkholderia cenocepacia]|jgi:hypothetical protein|uniref:hypothetical protein n=1 Tax=Burkholderia cenocepacia TaxID=95486 RepID=UPI0024B6B646|nr:hypothetical protein [Burkholderia cenocepacia]MDI9689729.1 hypothetical protein [Burkholderia cenocepacia]
MTALEYEHWKELSIGLARSYRTLTPKRSKLLLEEVEDCIDWVVCNGLDTVEDWDRSVRADSGLYHEAAGTRVDDYLWQHRYEFEREYRNGEVELVRGRFGDMLSACVRAGFDMAVAPSAGVIGFTIGDVRDVFDGSIPDWIADRFGENKHALLTAGRDEGVWL